MNKISKEDNTKIADFQERYAQLLIEVGKNFMRQVEIERDEALLKQRASDMLYDQQELYTEMEEKYGERFLDLDIDDS